jgi:prevent-host-death family protein
MAWQIQEARQKFSRLVQQALADGPQIVTRRGEEVVVVLSAAEFRRLTGEKPDFKTYLLSGPDLGDLEFGRPAELPREAEL